ncbi:hypothetical protein D3C80_1746290 [compost metagenome]
MADHPWLVRIAGAPQTVSQRGATSMQYLNQQLDAEGHDLQRQPTADVLLPDGRVADKALPIAVPQPEPLSGYRSGGLRRQLMRQYQTIDRQRFQVRQRRNHAVHVAHAIPVSIAETDRMDPVQGGLSDGRH